MDAYLLCVYLCLSERERERQKLIEWYKHLLTHLLFNCNDSVTHSDDSLTEIVPVNANNALLLVFLA